MVLVEAIKRGDKEKREKKKIWNLRGKGQVKRERKGGVPPVACGGVGPTCLVKYEREMQVRARGRVVNSPWHAQ